MIYRVMECDKCKATVNLDRGSKKEIGAFFTVDIKNKYAPPIRAHLCEDCTKKVIDWLKQED